MIGIFVLAPRDEGFGLMELAIATPSEWTWENRSLHGIFFTAV